VGHDAKCLEGPGIVAALMSASALPTAASPAVSVVARPRRLAFLGPPAWLETSSPPAQTSAHRLHHLSVLASTDIERGLREVATFAPDVTVVFDPPCLPADALRGLPGVTLGVFVGGVDGDDRGAAAGRAADALDRVLSFRPDLTGRTVGSTRMWRAIPPPISDELFAPVRPLHGRPRTMTIGRSTEYREHMLLPAKHHHDVLQVISGVGGARLAELMGEYDVGVYVAREYGGGFGAQVGVHLAAGQLLFAHDLEPAHGLERDIDYLHFDSPGELVWALDRLARFPEMYQRQRVRGHMKAEGYRASRVFDRVIHDLLLDVDAFGTQRTRA
jgi:hypothetical protein